MKIVKMILFYSLFATVLYIGCAFVAPSHGERFSASSLAPFYWGCAMILFVPSDLWLHHNLSRFVALGVLALAGLMSLEYYWFCDEYRLIIHLNSNDKISLADKYNFHRYWIHLGIVAGYLLSAAGVSHLIKRKKSLEATVANVP
ncbi:hypothetical protein J8K95_14610 [Bacteroides fragilis]|uniref:hypothetical protein n=1 Tax=Bacteroides fragilis TaxID=817 RepID=UPI00202EF91D|nr:hypothetical protein [Bacteroides fragilis]MCM0295910.1 hypothetical protein [Bacteroides fragilis]